ncbi:unnamed protein product [Strongylus vulgaris]|uniref:Nucleotide-diphospho-sugar transferase domain-containing protein n=1 Tax=Strongylus vulgaris TaxID=40348 RepID=A0A3P7JMH5_STRVU|nr:unnamed protein product [Strongylus vulgaris]
MSSESFKATVNSLPPNEETFVLILNSHALNMTLNWLCNTEGLKGVHNKSLVVTLDKKAANTLRELWPNVRQFNWLLPALEDTFWAESLSNVNVETRQEDIVFDRASEVGDLIAGQSFHLSDFF